MPHEYILLMLLSSSGAPATPCYSITSHTKYSHIIHISHSSLCRSCHALTDVTQFVDLLLRGLINSKNRLHSDDRTRDLRFTTFIYFLVCYTMLYHWRFLLLVFKSFRFPVISSCFMPFHSVMSQSVAILKPGILLANLEMSAPSLF